MDGAGNGAEIHVHAHQDKVTVDASGHRGASRGDTGQVL